MASMAGRLPYACDFGTTLRQWFPSGVWKRDVWHFQGFPRQFLYNYTYKYTAMPERDIHWQFCKASLTHNPKTHKHPKTNPSKHSSGKASRKKMPALNWMDFPAHRWKLPQGLYSTIVPKTIADLFAREIHNHNVLVGPIRSRTRSELFFVVIRWHRSARSDSSGRGRFCTHAILIVLQMPWFAVLRNFDRISFLHLKSTRSPLLY